MRLSTPSSSSHGLVLATSRSGARYVSYEGLHLNSPYDPVREAVRFLDDSQAPEAPATVLILGDTLPYLRNAVHERYPAAQIISLYLHDDLPALLHGQFPPLPPDDYWSPGSSTTLRDYLTNRLPLDDLHRLAVLQWAPALRAFPARAREATRTVEQIVREGAGEWVTTAAFARSWTHNLLTNFLSIDTWHLLESHHAPVVVAASGPSLSRAFPQIRRYRSRLALVALPSSLEALASAGIAPDLLVTVDAGYWAQLHLRAIDSRDGMLVALPLTAARGVWRHATRPVILSSGSFVERELFQQIGAAPAELRVTATVSASALELAGRWTSGPIIVAGLDLCLDGLQEHVRPHPFDTHFETATSRTRPYLTIAADRLLRLGLVRSRDAPSTTPALRTYAGWFRDWSTSGRIHRLNPSRISLDGFSPASDLSVFIEPNLRQPALPTPRPAPTPPFGERKRAVARLLDSWTRALEDAGHYFTNEHPSGAATGEQRAFELLSCLLPKTYLRYRRAARSGSGETAEIATELFERALTEVTEMKRRYAS